MSKSQFNRSAYVILLVTGCLFHLKNSTYVIVTVDISDKVFSDDLPDITPPKRRCRRRVPDVDHSFASPNQTATEKDQDVNIQVKENKDTKLRGDVDANAADTPSHGTLHHHDTGTSSETLHSADQIFELLPLQADVSEARRVKLFGMLCTFNETVKGLTTLAQEKYIASDQYKFSPENEALAEEFLQAGRLLRNRGDLFMLTGTLMKDTYNKYKDGTALRHLVGEENNRNPSSESENEEDSVLEPVKPVNICHNVSATGQYRVGKTKSKKGKYICQICSLDFTKKETLDGHLLLHAGESYSCDVCSLTFNSKEYLRQHMVTHVKGQIICEVCSKTFSSKSNLTAHKLLHANPEYKCDKCEASYTTKGNLKYHITQKHSGAVKKKGTVICGTCSSTFNGIASLRTHTWRYHRDIRREELKEKIKKHLIVQA